MPKITVIVPVYKVEDYLEKCINSIKDQSFRDFELILVDDGSPGGCPSICDEYVEKLYAAGINLIVIHQKNGGLSAARNSGIDWTMRCSSSEWISFIDSDDSVSTEYLGELYDACIRNDADLGICDFTAVNENGDYADSEHSFPDIVVHDANKKFELLYSNWRLAPAWCKLYRKSFFKDVKFPNQKLHEDELIIQHTLFKSSIVAYSSKQLYYYIVRSNSITRTVSLKVTLDAIEANIDRFLFCKENHISTDDKLLNVNYMKRFVCLKVLLNKEERIRYKELDKKYMKIFFSSPKNVTSKNILMYFLYRTYQLIFNREEINKLSSSSW